MTLTKKDYDHKYYLKNRDKILANNKEYFNKNRERLRPKINSARRKFSKTPSGIYHTLSSNARRRNLYCLTKEDFIEWYGKQIKICFYCVIPESKLIGKFVEICGRKTKRLSIERLNEKLGYITDNMALCCLRCNIIKNDFFTPEEMKQLSLKFIKPKWQE